MLTYVYIYQPTDPPTHLRQEPPAADEVAAVGLDARHDVGHVLVEDPNLGRGPRGQQRGAVPPLAGQHHAVLAHEREGEASLWGGGLGGGG